MGLFDFFKKTKKRIDYDISQLVHASVRKSMNMPTYRQRETADKYQQSNFFWYEGVIGRGEFRTKHVMDNLKLIRDINPDASMAIWNFLRLANSGHELDVLNPRGKEDPRATEDLNSLAANIGKLYGGGTDQLINVLLLTAFTQGAIALEVELNDSLTDVVDFHPVDPATLDFRRNQDTQELELVQKQRTGEYKVLNQETVFYYPFDPDIGDPYGRSPILPVLQIIFFQIEVLRDLKRVVHHQGHRRFDIKVVEEAILTNMPDEIKHQGPEAVRDYVSGYISDIQAQMNDLEPDDDFFHTDSVEIDLAGGAIQQSIDVTRVIDVINQQIVTSLKQLPILLGRNEGTTETHGTIQWQIYVKGIESVQRGIKRLLERAYNITLQIKGYQGTAKLTFDALQTTDRQKDANAEKTETETKILQINQGWIDNDEAALDIVGHEAVGEPIKPTIPQPQPQQVPADGQTTDGQTNNGGTDNGNSANARFTNVTPLKKKYLTRADDVADEFVAQIKESWAEDVAKVATRAKNAYFRLLKDQRDNYIKRLEKAPDIPSRVFSDAHSFRSITRDDVPDPPDLFQHWVNVNILYDSQEQMTLINEEGRDWMEQAIQLAGTAVLAELVADMNFNMRDQNLVRWLQERSLRSAQLIQGVSDEAVLKTLWDVVYEGHFTIAKASRALKESFAFSDNRATTIARTEIISAGRSGQYHADFQSGIVIGKRWAAAHQERTRPGHLGADGQTVPFEDPFWVKNKNGVMEPLLFPGDSSLGATASNTIQCRCFYERILEGESM